MKIILQFTLLLLFMLVLLGTVRFASRASAAQSGPEELFESAISTQPLLGTDDTGVVRFRPVRLKTAALERAGATLATSAIPRAALTLNLFDDVRQEAWLERVERRAGAEVYIGRLKDIPGSFVHLSISQGQMAGSVAWSNQFYAMRYAGNGFHLIQQINQNAMLRDAEPLPAQPDQLPAAPLVDDGSLIDVMVVYTSAARTGAGGEAAIQSLINLGISETNTAYANSQVVQRLRLVHTAEVSYTETGNSSTDLSRLRSTSDGFMDNIHALRDTYRADLVTLIINSSSDGNCGVGYLMNGINPGFASSAFNVVRRSCVSPNYSFGHELGHNQGLNHAREDPTGNGAFNYSFGFKDPNSVFRTVMAYNCSPSCPRVLHFSNPAVGYNERSTGIDPAQSNSAHNAQSLNNSRVTVANFRSGAGGAGLQFYPLAAPVRLLDTRAGQSACHTPNAPIAGGTPRNQLARGQCGGQTIPANTAAITGNITTVNSGGGYLTLYPSDAAQPTVANSNYTPNEILNNVFTVGLGANDGAFKIFVTSNTDVVVDVTGYYAPPGGANPPGLYFHPLPQPRRLLDTRPGFAGCFVPGIPLPANLETPQLARLSCDGVIIPAGALAIAGNATTVNPTGGGYLTLFPADAARPIGRQFELPARTDHERAIHGGAVGGGHFQNLFDRANRSGN